MATGDRFPGRIPKDEFYSSEQAKYDPFGTSIGERDDPASGSDAGIASVISLFKRLLATKFGVFGEKNDTAAPDDSGEFSLISLVKRLLGKIPVTNNRIDVNAEVAIPAIGTTSDASAGSDTANASLISLTKRILARLTELLPQTGGKIAIALPPIGEITDTAATTDIGDFTLISLAKRLLGKLPALTSNNRLDADVSFVVPVEVVGVATSGLNAEIVAATNVSGYRYISLQIVASPFTGSFQFQASNDGTIWLPVHLEQKTVVDTSANYALSGTTSGIWGGYLGYKFFRVRITAYTSGSAIATALFYNQAPQNTSVRGAVNLLNASIAATTTGQGTIAHDSPISTQFPVVVGGNARTANYIPVANDDVTRLITTTVGAIINSPYSIPEQQVQAVIGPIATTGNNVVFSAAGTGTRNYLTFLAISNNSATATLLEIKDGTVAIFRVLLTGNQSLIIPFSHYLKSTANTILNAEALTAGASVTISAVGFRAP
jgi:hypothetical protein